MKPEPLKGKDLYQKFVYYHEDVESAVEWLKARLYTLNLGQEIELIEKQIDEAFEDVTKEVNK